MGEFSIGRVDVSSCASTPAEPTDLAEVAEDERSRLLLRDKAGNSWASLPSFFIAVFLLCSLRRQVSLLRQPSSLLSRPDFFLAKRRRSLGTAASFVDLLRLAAVFLCKKSPHFSSKVSFLFIMQILKVFDLITDRIHTQTHTFNSSVHHHSTIRSILICDALKHNSNCVYRPQGLN